MDYALAPASDRRRGEADRGESRRLETDTRRGSMLDARAVVRDAHAFTHEVRVS